MSDNTCQRNKLNSYRKRQAHTHTRAHTYTHTVTHPTEVPLTTSISKNHDSTDNFQTRKTRNHIKVHLKIFMAARNEIYSQIIKITLLTQHAILRCNKSRKFLSAKQKSSIFITSGCGIRCLLRKTFFVNWNNQGGGNRPRKDTHGRIFNS